MPRRLNLTLATVAIAFLAGCGSTRTITDTATLSTTTTQTTTTTVVKHGPPPPAKTTTVVHTVTAQPTPTSSFSGNGTENVGTINVGSPSTIQWACRCSTFGLFSDVTSGSPIDIDSTAGSGTSAVDSGTYTNVHVISDGNWAFRVVPG